MAITTALVSCSKDLEQDGGLLSTPLVFSPTTEWPEMETGKASGNGTKALINSANDLQDYGISLFATATKGGDTYPVFNNDELKFTDGAWNYDLTKYWIPGAKYSFAAFAPYAGTESNSGKNKISNGSVSISNIDDNHLLKVTGYNTGKGVDYDARTEDLIGAQYTRDNTWNDDFSVVPLEFEHLLSCVAIYIRNATNTDIVSLSDIKLTGLKYLCDITITSSSISLDTQNEVAGDGIFTSENRGGSGNTFLPKGMAEADYKPLFDCDYLTLLPQSLWGENIIITLKAGNKTYSANLGNIPEVMRWNKGKKYRYNITITSTDIVFQVVEVPWIEHDVEL